MLGDGRIWKGGADEQILVRRIDRIFGLQEEIAQGLRRIVPTSILEIDKPDISTVLQCIVKPEI